jgi:putative hydrolase of HD superfamily
MRFEEKLAFICELDKLKSIIRANRLHDGSRRENTAEHSWHLATALLALADEPALNIDLLKALKIALIHDIVEIDAGDTYFFDTKAAADKAEREERAAQRIFGLLGQPLAREFHQLWHELEEGKSAEARVVRALDRILPFLSHMANHGMVWAEKGMSRELLLSRMTDLKALPPLWQYFTEAVDRAVAEGWLAKR